MAFNHGNNLLSSPLGCLTILLLIVLSYDQPASLAETVKGSGAVNEAKLIRARFGIGSRPPRCDGRCGSCGRCEAVQVPTNPQLEAVDGRERSSRFRSLLGTGRGRSEGRGNTDYMPVSWKCKCGKFIFDP
ncbi:hypothetical protein MLD38_008101 [Melastoma candidum]|uniref:Uncharacterized protein n=1 Tax=Melastoma candidum TaxID=119954 RepID=A0ACB9RSD3_9MYRT|nr:hypothetical protein MLD38_008101 [Melastoma candidum]